MIDTIVLLLDQNQYKIFKPEKFYPHADKLLNPSFHMGGSYAQARQNPTKWEMKMGIYKPRLTLTKRFKQLQRYDITLKVEYSVPKLLFGNNFDELEQSDLEKAAKRLVSVLNQMGVHTTFDDIMKARIGAIHYSKNIPLTDHTSPSMYLRELSKVNMNMKLDVNQTDFRNGGHSLKYRTNKREIVFYDKMKDLQQARFSEKRSEEIDNVIQLDLFCEKKMQKPLEVLRIEIRLGDMSNIRRSLSDAGIRANVVYNELCSVQVARAVIKSYWSQMRDNYIPVLSDHDMNPEDYLRMLLCNNLQVGKSKLLAFVGMKVLTDSIGMRDLRTTLESFGYTGWYRLINELKSLKMPESSGLLDIVDQTITSFAPLRLVDFEEQMINNDKHEN